VALQKEFAQAMSRAEVEGLTDRQALHSVITDPANRYLARHLCWVFTIHGMETYIIVPRDPTDLDLLVQTVRPEPRGDDVDVVIGVLGPTAPPEVCGGLSLPLVMFDQLYSFDRESLISSIPQPEGTRGAKAANFRAAAEEVFDRVFQLADNAGATDEHRALNYLAVRYPAIYALAAEAHGRNSSFTAVGVRISRLSGVRLIVDVIFTYTHRQTDVAEKYFIRVDVTEEFPFLVTKLSPYYDR
jgi:hypothetical protein